MIIRPIQSCFLKWNKNSNIRCRSSSQSSNVTSTYDLLNWKNGENSHKVISSCNIVTFNMLAPCYKRTFFRSIRSRESSEADKWFIRAQRTVQFLRQEICPTATIIALQEFWLQEEYYSIFRHVFEIEGFEVRYLRRTGSKTDAVALLIRKNIFDVLGSENISLCGQNDRVALLLWLQHKSTGKHFLVVNTHLSFPHSVFDKMAQVRQMQTVTEAIDRFALRYRITRSTRIILGDFNVENQSPVCDHLRASGYSSCFDISPPIEITSSASTRGSNSHGQSNAHTSANVHTSSSQEDNHIGLPESYFDDTAAPASALSSFGNSSDFTLDQEHNKEHPVLIENEHGLPLTETEGKINESAQSIPFDSHAAFVQSRLELLRQTRLLRSRPSFVSHFNHRQEEVGVDHIFIQPEAVLDLRALSGVYSSTSVSSGALNSAVNNINPESDTDGGVTRTVISANASYTRSMSKQRPIKGSAFKANAIGQGAHFVPLTHGNNHHSNHHGRGISDACVIPDNKDNFTRPGLEDARDDENVEQAESELSNVDEQQTLSSEGVRVSRINAQSRPGKPKNDQVNFENLKPYSIFVSQCYVLPTSLTSKVWHPEFQISDHRPISATFVIAESHK